ncbi:RidA family protein [Lysobacter korlensis]|uniref:RidA family protein n=1 Tax=Lysobacter korlensis TaxID=553636 RepID=A0ABV6RUF0_9GAMM
MEKRIINPSSIYAPTADFSQAIKVTGGSLLFVSGIVGYRLDGTMPQQAVDQADVAFQNLEKVLNEAGGSMADVVKVTVYLREDFRLHREQLRAVRARYFSSDFPVSTLVQVAGFANPDYLFEIEAMAVLPD